MKKLFVVVFLTLLSLLSISVLAEKGYLEAKDFSNISLQDFLTECKAQNKNAYFNKNTYTLTEDLNVLDGVDLIGEEGTIFQSTDIQRYIYDKENVKNITIEHIIFDNVTIWCQREASIGWTIQHNIFLNARNLDVSMGCKPDSHGKNGGPATGYYIQNKRGSMQILSNMFLRDSSSLGRGVATYFTTDVVIKDNYFGRLEDVEGSIVSLETKHLKEVAIASGLVDPTLDYGYFMTGINILNTDVNTKILGNYMSFNSNITEAGYEDGSQSTLGYNRDHFLYAKAFKNLEIVGNYFKGMNKNQDGGVKCRNGEGLLIYKNVLEDTLILLYVQDDATGAVLKNVDIRENIFINKDYSTKLIEIPYGNNQKFSKYLTVDYSILFLNYRQDSLVDSITISSNLFYSNGLGNEQIRIDNRDKTYNVPTNIFIANNKNVLGNITRVTTRNFKDQDNVDVRSDWNNGAEYQAVIDEEYKKLDIRTLARIQEVSYKISDGRLVTSAAKAYVNGIPYTNQVLTVGETYFLFLLNPTTSYISVEATTTEEVPSFDYTALEIEIQEKGFAISYAMNGHGTAIDSLENVHSLPNPLPTPQEVGYTFEGWFLDAQFSNPALAGSTITKDTILYAKWTKIESFTISFINNGHGENLTAIDNCTVIPELPTLEETGYTFEGWFLDATFTQAATLGTQLTKDITLYAKWLRKVYNVYFDTNGGASIPGQKVSFEDSAQEPSVPIKEGYVFEGWYEDGDLKTPFDFSRKIDSNYTLYAKWTKIKYRITYDIQGHGIKPEDLEVENSIPNVLPILEEEGYLFEGWYLDAACEIKVILGSNLQENITLYAKWTEIFYEVSFAEVDMTAVFVKMNGTLSKPTDPTKEGYTFEGWYKEKECINPWNFTTDKVTKDITLFPKWKKIENPTPVVYTITFEVNGGTPISAVKSLANNKLTEPTAPIKEGYTFEGWYKDSSFSDAWDFDKDIVNENLTLYAKWGTPTQSNSNNLATILSVSISIGVGILGLCVLAILVIRKKRLK